MVQQLEELCNWHKNGGLPNDKHKVKNLGIVIMNIAALKVHPPYLYLSISSPLSSSPSTASSVPLILQPSSQLLSAFQALGFLTTPELLSPVPPLLLFLCRRCLHLFRCLLCHLRVAEQ